MIRVITTIDTDLYRYLADRAADERRSLREQASVFLEQKLAEDRGKLRAQATMRQFTDSEQREKVPA